MALARLALLWEQVWAASWPASGVIGVFLTLSLADIWSLLPGAAHAAALAAFAVAAIVAAGWRLQRVRWPSRAAAERRLEHDGGVAHRPIAALSDTPATATDAESAALWRAHQAQAAEAALGARLRRPAPGLARRDPFALRLAVLVAVASSALLAGSEAPARLTSALSLRFGGAGEPARLDAWITPPTYTGRPPIILAGPRVSEDDDRTIAAPAGSTLSLRLSGGRGRAELALRGRGLSGARLALDEAEGGGRSLDVELTESGTAELRRGAFTRRWRFDVSPDAAPQARFTDDPAVGDDNRLTLQFAVMDDYGVAHAEARLGLAPEQDPLDGAPPISQEALAQKKSVPLTLSGSALRDADQTVTVDLTSHPWAGLEVDVTIAVADQAGQEGVSETRRIRLPEREFFAPMAQAAIEQRRILTIAPRRWPQVAQAFDAMTVGPELFFETARDYLLVRSVYWSLLNSQGYDLNAMGDRLWDLALRLEDGDLSLARRALEAAMEALRAALERGAPGDEIAALTDDVRAALERYLAALTADALARQEFAEGGGEDAWNTDDLREMLSAIQELAETGARRDAEHLLSELEAMLQNMQVAAGGAGGDGDPGREPSELEETQKDLSNLIYRQRRLLDETYRENQRAQSDPDAGADDGDALAGDQQGLSEALEELMNRLDGAGREGEGALERAGRAMREAQRRLQDGALDGAVGSQSQAIEQLGRAAQAIAQAMQDETGERLGEGAGRQGLDPLGRPTGAMGANMGDQVDVPDGGDYARARELLDELRRRAADPARSDEERAYIERLLRRF